MLRRSIMLATKITSNFKENIAHEKLTLHFRHVYKDIICSNQFYFKIDLYHSLITFTIYVGAHTNLTRFQKPDG